MTFLAFFLSFVLKGVLADGEDDSTCLKAASCSCIHCWKRERT